MLHLLPENHRKVVLAEYRKRLAIVIACAVTVVSVIGMVFLLPSYIISQNHYQDIKDKKDLVDREITAGQNSANGDTVKKIAESVSILEPLGSPIPASAAFNRFLSHVSGNNISLSYIDYLPNSDNSVTIDVTGIAGTRDSLAAFINGLQADPYFSGVSLPLSNFVKETNIDFSIKMEVSASSTPGASST